MWGANVLSRYLIFKSKQWKYNWRNGENGKTENKDKARGNNRERTGKWRKIIEKWRNNKETEKKWENNWTIIKRNK